MMPTTPSGWRSRRAPPGRLHQATARRSARIQPAQVSPRICDAVEARELLEQLGFLRGTHAEVGGDRVADSGGVLAQHAREPREALAPLG